MLSLIKHFRSSKSLFGTYSRLIDVSSEVGEALKGNKPVVALESTIITHGMPNPQNLNTALQVEEIIREQGVVPATIGVVDGRVKVGLDKNQLMRLADPSTKKIKISRRDFPYAASNGLSGGTTVSGTIMIAKAVGINIFVTGGIGGVHKNGESTLDISADLKELGMNSIMTVCSGVKSILDIERTLEYLETEGVCVVRYGQGDSFPAFYSQESMYPAPYRVKTPREAAKLLQAMLDLNMDSGVILAVPVPKEFSIDYETMEAHISLALKKAKEEGKSGKDITPFVLSEIANITKGKSLLANIALIKNNALVGAKVAKEHIQVASQRYSKKAAVSVVPTLKNPVVIGGSNLDFIVRLTTDMKMDGRTLDGRVSVAAGGVGRNLVDCLGKLSFQRPLFISAVGQDLNADFILASINHVDCSGVVRKHTARSASYTTVIDRNGETRFGVGDMEIHSTIDKVQLMDHKKAIANSSMLVIDGNIPTDTITLALEIAHEHGIISWYEPTDLAKATKPFATPLWKHLTLVTPNLNELREMARVLGYELHKDFSVNIDDKEKLIEEVTYLAKPLAKEIPLVMVTMGRHGLMMLSRCKVGEPVMSALQCREGELHARHYGSLQIPRIENTSGAGDCTAAGFMTGVLGGLDEESCVRTALEAGRASLLSTKPVPDSLLPVSGSG